MDIRAVLAGSELFQGLESRALDELAEATVERTYPAGGRLWNAGDGSRGLCLVLEGSVRVLGLHRDRQYVIHEEGPGDTLGELPLFLGTLYPASAVAVTRVLCLLIHRDALRRAMAADVDLSWRLVRRMAGRVDHLLTRMQGLATATVRGRLAEWLLAHPGDDDRHARVDRTQEELAEDLGTVREVVARELAALRRAGFIGPAVDGKLPILDRSSLLEIARRGRA